jgi:hypothetical protein
MLMLEAHRRFVAPRGFDHTWLLFDAERASSSFLCAWLGFTSGERAFEAEYGPSRVLVRDERAPQSGQAIRRAEQYLAQLQKPASLMRQLFARSIQRHIATRPRSVENP